MGNVLWDTSGNGWSRPGSLPAIKPKNHHKCRHHAAILAPLASLERLTPLILPGRTPSRGKSPCRHTPLPGYPPGGGSLRLHL